MFRELGLILALLCTLFAFEYSSSEKADKTLITDAVLVIEEESIPITRDSPPPPPEIPKEPTVSDFLDIVDDDIKIEHDLVINTEDNKDLGVALKDFIYGTGGQVDEELIDDEINFMIVEEKPRFQGGDENTFTKWVSERIEYPEVAKENGIHGRVLLSFAINTDGRLIDVSIIRSVDPAVDKEAVRVVSMSPRWTPGRQRDKPVKVRYIFPVIFQLR